MATGETLEIPYPEKMAILRRQIAESIERIDEYRGILHIRRHLAATPVLKSIYNFRATRIALLQARTRAELESILDHIERDILPDESRRIFPPRKEREGETDAPTMLDSDN